MNRIFKIKKKINYINFWSLFGNNNNYILALPKPETGYSWTTITKQMKDQNVYKTIRTEWKKSRKFYEKLEASKKKAAAPAKK